MRRSCSPSLGQLQCSFFAGIFKHQFQLALGDCMFGAQAIPLGLYLVERQRRLCLDTLAGEQRRPAPDWRRNKQRQQHGAQKSKSKI